MLRNLPPLNALRAFDAAGRHESFSRAAEELGVSHSAISRHVRGLEHRLGTQLFKDASRGVVLTPAGRQYLDRVMPALNLIAEATDELAETPTGRVTINSEPLFAAKVVIPRLQDFYDRFPEIDLRMDVSHSLADLERYEADLAIRFAHKGGLDLPSDLLSDAPLIPVAVPGLIEGDTLTADDLRRHRLYRDRGNDVWQRWCEAAGIDPTGVPYSRWRVRAPYALEAALQGLGIYLGSADCLEGDLRSGRLVRLSDVSIQEGAYHLVTGPQGARNKSIRQVRQWLVDQTASFRSTQT